MIINQKTFRYLIFTYIFLSIHPCIVAFFPFFRHFQWGSVYYACSSATIVRRSTPILIEHLQQQKEKISGYRNNNLKFNIFTIPTFEGIYDRMNQIVRQGSGGHTALSGMFPEFDLVAQQHLMNIVIENGRQFHFG